MEYGFLLVIFFGLIISSIIFVRFYFTQKAVVKRKLKKAAGVKISSFLSGEIAKVAGSVEFVGQPLIAPLSGRRCAYYYVLVEQLISTGKNSYWEEMIEEEIGGTFVIRDGRYRGYIDKSSTLKTYLVQDCVYRSGTLNDATEALENYLRNKGMKSVNMLGLNKTLRYKEGVLEEGESVAVMGRGEWKSSKEVSLLESFGKILVLSSTAEEPIYLSDDPDTVEITYNGLPEVEGAMKF